MKNKRAMALFLAATMLVSTAMTGCGEKKDDTKDTAKTEDTSDVAEKDVKKVNGVMYEKGLPIVDDGDYKFSLFVDGGMSIDGEPMMMPILKEQTGIDVDLKMYPWEVAQERYALELGAGDYADCIGGWCISPRDILLYGCEMGIFVPLEDYFEKYCPRITEILELEGVREKMTAPDGHIYSIPYVLEAPAVDFNPWINVEWLKNVGMEMPTTTEELREVLRAFQEQDANGNGDPTDEIPFSGNPENKHLAYLSGYFGMSMNEEGFSMDGDQLVFGATSDAYKEAIKYLRSLYEENLVDQELFTQDSVTWKGKGSDDKYGVCVMYGGGDIMPTEPGEKSVWEPLPVLKSDYCENPVWLRNTYGNSVLKNQVVITDNAEHPEAICRWWDNFFELDNAVMSQNGDEKVVTKYEDGTYRKIDVKTLSEEEQKKYEWGNLWPQSLPKYIPAGFKIKSEIEYKEIDYGKIRDDLYEPYMTEKTLPDTWPDEDVIAEMADLQVAISEYLKSCQAQWIAGESDVEEDWDGFKEALNDMGLERYLELKGAVLAE